MTIRYPDKFRIEMEIDDRMIDYKIPRMCIQPILENAITYALGRNDINVISLSIRIAEPDIIITVNDSGIGMKEEALTKLNERLNTILSDTEFTGLTEHIALQNIQRRVRAYFGNDYGLSVKSTEGKGTEVTLRLLCKEEIKLKYN
jgi:two-component system sensor histidine kinase YesM